MTTEEKHVKCSVVRDTYIERALPYFTILNKDVIQNYLPSSERKIVYRKIFDLQT